MPLGTQVSRLGRQKQRVRTDLWPDAPQIPQALVDKFPELGDFNEQMRDFVEKMRNATEPDTTTTQA